MKNIFSICLFLIIFSFLGFYGIAEADNITTYIYITICDDGIVNDGEVCDDGEGYNTGSYSTSIADRVCNSTCTGWGPYCGDAILQMIQGEECDDGNNTSGDLCASLCKEEEPPPVGGGSTPRGSISGGGGLQGIIPSVIPTKVLIKGKAYPSANVNILMDGNVIGVVSADTNADFVFSTTDVRPGVATFGFWAEDKTGLRSISFTATFEVVQSAMTTLAGIFLPPTIGLSKNHFKSGELLIIKGQSVPKVKVITNVNSDTQLVIESDVTKEGDWSAQVDTASLENEEFHTAKASFVLGDLGSGLIKSGFSRAVSFYVGEKEVRDLVSADINGDGRVNLVDFSIFLVNWGSDDIRSDFNGDGKVDLIDFSILLFQWTG